MADIDKSLIGDVLNALPMDQMVAGPLNAMVSAQINASKAYVDFLTSVCIKDGKAEAVEFSYEETVVDESGSPILDSNNKPQVLTKNLKVPLLAVVSHPNITIEEGTIDFEMEVSQSASESSSTEAEASLEGGINWGVFSVSVKGRVSHKSEQTRSTDTRAKYSFHTRAARQGPPEAMMRVIEFMTNSQTKPINGEAIEAPKKPEPKKPEDDKK